MEDNITEADYFNFEHFPGYEKAHQWYGDNWTLSLWVSAIYLCVIFGIKYALRNKSPFHLQTPLILWNFHLAAFNITASMRMLPGFLNNIDRNGIWNSMCNTDSHERPPFTFWANLYVASRLLDLGDTVFIVLRKRPLMFIQWYHHMTLLIYTWYSNIGANSPALAWFMMVNYVVHAVMYTYYTLKSLGFYVPKIIAMAITLFQISQMVVGIIVNYVNYTMKSSGIKCTLRSENIVVSAMMYLSYLLLFCYYFYKAYLSKKTSKKSINGIQNGNVANIEVSHAHCNGHSIKDD